MSTHGATGSAAGRRLGYLLKHTGRLVSAANDTALAPLGIDSRELGVLIVIDGNEPASQQQMAERIGVDRTTMVAMLDAMEAKDLLARRPDSEDRRRNVVELTRSGQAMLARAIAASDVAEAEVLSRLTLQEAAELRRLLGQLVAGD